MRELRLSKQVDLAQLEILRESRKRFGAGAVRRYRALLRAAFQDILAEPDRLAMHSQLDLPQGVNLYPISSSRMKLAPGDRPASASHLLAYRYDDIMVEILDILHERMDIPTRLG